MWRAPPLLLTSYFEDCLWLFVNDYSFCFPFKLETTAQVATRVREPQSNQMRIRKVSIGGRWLLRRNPRILLWKYLGQENQANCLHLHVLMLSKLGTKSWFHVERSQCGQFWQPIHHQHNPVTLHSAFFEEDLRMGMSLIRGLGWGQYVYTQFHLFPWKRERLSKRCFQNFVLAISNLPKNLGRGHDQTEPLPPWKYQYFESTGCWALSQNIKALNHSYKTGVRDYVDAGFTWPVPVSLKNSWMPWTLNPSFSVNGLTAVRMFLPPTRHKCQVLKPPSHQFFNLVRHQPQSLQRKWLRLGLELRNIPLCFVCLVLFLKAFQSFFGTFIVNLFTYDCIWIYGWLRVKYLKKEHQIWFQSWNEVFNCNREGIIQHWKCVWIDQIWGKWVRIVQPNESKWSVCLQPELLWWSSRNTKLEDFVCSSLYRHWEGGGIGAIHSWHVGIGGVATSRPIQEHLSRVKVLHCVH